MDKTYLNAANLPIFAPLPIKNPMRVLILLFVFFLNIQILSAQKFYASNHPNYISNVDSADYHFENEDYELAKPFFEKALAVDDYSFMSKYRLSICHFEIGDKGGNDWLLKCADRNWEHLYKTEENQYKEELSSYSELINWEKIESICQTRHNQLDRCQKANYHYKSC